MIHGFVWMVLSYGLSQFYRACLAVFAPALERDIGLGADQVSTALGLWFLIFAGMQIPVGWLLDHKSPRWTAAILLAAGGGGGAILFGLATGPTSIYLAMSLIGIGCSPVLMASFYVFARQAPPERFGTLAGLLLGLGSLGNVAASLPLTVAMDLMGWRVTMFVLAGLTLCVSLALIKFVKDPPRLAPASASEEARYRDLFRLWPLYPVLAIALVAYAPGAGLRGSWIGGYLTEVYGQNSTYIGQATLAMAAAMIVGSLTFGPLDRVIRSWRVIVAGSAGITLLLLVVLWRTAGALPLTQTVVLFAAIGFMASSYPQVMNNARALLPERLVGRGVTLANLCSIGGAGLAQVATGKIYATRAREVADVSDAYADVFLFFCVALFIGLVLYLMPLKRRSSQNQA